MTGPPAELRETSGMTSRLVLAYAQREGGRPAVERVLELAGCAGREAELLDERSWFSFATKVRLFEALAEALEDPVVTRHAGQAALDLSVGDGLKVALRALGSPRLVYQHIVRANGKFSAIHDMELLSLGRDRATISFADKASVDYGVHRLDCEYNKGLLSVVPALFGMGHAHVSHASCAVEGADRCVYELSWQHSRLTARNTVATGAVATAGVAVSALAAPVLLPVAAGAAVAAGGALAVAHTRGRRARWRSLEAELQGKELVSNRLAASLQDLVAELDVNELLAKIVEHAHAAVGSKEFVLLVADAEGQAPRAQASTGVPDPQVSKIEDWVAARHATTTEPVLVEDVTAEPLLAELPRNGEMPIGSVCLTPLRFRGANVGHLVALAPQARTFLPRDVDLVESYAVQAAIALANARLFADQRALATRDPLTGLLNHREFHESIDRELDRARRHGGEAAVALFDLDGFKLVNDGAGHAEGDRVLRDVASAMAGACRASDLAFRIGGDEFALLLPETGRDEARVVANRVREAIAGVDARVGVSFGMASWPDDGGSKDVLLASADAALYAMKGGTRRSRRLPGRPVPDAGADPGGGTLMRERLAMASRLSSHLAPVLTPERIAEVTVGELHHAFAYLAAYVQRVDAEAGLLRTVAVGGTIAEGRELPLWTQRLDQGVGGRVARTRQVALVHDTTLDADHLAFARVFPGTDVALRSALSVPLHVGGRVWGILSLQDTHPGAFTSDDVLLLETVGAQVAAALHRSELFAELDGAFATTLGVLCDALEAKDAATASHAHDVGELAFAVGVRLGLDDDALRDLRYGALLHDVGKIAVPTEILRKPGALTPEERTEIERHTIVGAEMLARIPFFARIVPLVRSSHERWDGGGYPDRLAGDAIPLGARIVCACDAFDAMTTDRPYRAARSTDEALEELRACAGTHFDPAVVAALAALVEARRLAAARTA